MNARVLLLVLPLLSGCIMSTVSLGKVPNGTSAVAYSNQSIKGVANCIAEVENTRAEIDETRYVIRSVDGTRTYYVAPNDGSIYSTQVAVAGSVENGERGEKIGLCAANGVVAPIRE